MIESKLQTYPELLRDARVLVLRWRIASEQLDGCAPRGDAWSYWHELECAAWAACMGKTS